MTRIVPSLTAASLLAATLAFAPHQDSSADGARDADRAAIRAHIESICQAFIDGDIDAIHDTHTEDWRGFLEDSRVPIKGIDEYMRANGIPWPRPAGLPGPQKNPNAPSAGFKIFDFDVHFLGPDTAVVCFMLDFGQKRGDDLSTGNRLRIMDVYARRGGHWIQAASHTVIDPAWKSERLSQASTLSPRSREQILSAREAVWKAYFGNDLATLEKLVPDDVIAMEGDSKEWSNRAAVLDGARRFAESGGKLVSLEFPKTEIQAYGNTIIIYTTYHYETDVHGERRSASGRGTEMFVRRNGAYVNVGWHLDSMSP